MIRKKYIGDGLPPAVGDYSVLNKDTNEVIVSDRTKEDCDTIAHGYNHQYCKPHFPDKYIVKHKSEL